MSTSDGQPALEFRGRMLSMSMLRVNTNDLEEIANNLREQTTRSALLRELPIVLDLQVQIIDMDGLLDILRREHMKVIGAVRGAASMEAAVRRTGLAVIRDPGDRSGAAKKEQPAEASPAPAAVEVVEKVEPEVKAEGEPAAKVKIHRTPVRSGQQMYVRGGDCTLTAPVGAGAEVIADGNLHIYAPLRGRAIAGAQGDDSACIFCHSLEAELVAIAGCYMVADDLPNDMRGRAVQISLNKERLEFKALD